MAPNPTTVNDETIEDYDDAPAFLSRGEAVEVKVDDNAPMDDDDEAMEDSKPVSTSPAPETPIEDVSKASFNSHSDAIYAVASHYNPTNHTLSIVSGGGDDRAYLHAVTTANGSQICNTIPLTHPHTDSISCVSFNTPFITNDGSGKLQENLCAVGSYDGNIVVYNGDNGQCAKVLEGPSDVEFLSFHPKGGTVLLAGSMDDGTIWMYHTPSNLRTQANSCLQVFVGHEGGVTGGGFTPDGKNVVSVGQDGTCRIWAPKRGVCKHTFKLSPGGLTCLALGGGQDGQLALVGGEDGKAYIVHIGSKKLVATLPHFEESKDTNVASAVLTGQEKDDNVISEARSLEAVGFCPPNIPGMAHWCATGGVDGVLKIWNMNVGAAGAGTAQLRQCCVREDQPKAGITRLQWHASLSLVICAYTDGVVGVWDVRAGTMVRSLTGHADMINDMDVSFLGTAAVIVTGSDDKCVKMFELH